MTLHVICGTSPKAGGVSTGVKNSQMGSPIYEASAPTTGLPRLYQKEVTTDIHLIG